MLGVWTNRFQHQVQFVGAIDLARYDIGHIGPDELSFREVIEPVNPLGVAVLKQKHRTRSVFRPGEQEQMVGAEIEHGETTEAEGDAGIKSGSESKRSRPLWQRR